MRLTPQSLLWSPFAIFMVKQKTTGPGRALYFGYALIMNPGQLDSVKMMEVVVSRGNSNRGNQKWLSLSALVVVTLLVVVSNQHGQESLSEHRMSTSTALAKNIKAQTLMEGPPIASGVAAATLTDVKVSHRVAQSLPSETLPSSTLSEDQSAPPKVRVRLFMESKCPACKMFTSQYVNKVLHADGVSRKKCFHELLEWP
jgi:hypothetical protein